MEVILQIVKIFTIVSFLFFGGSCLTMDYMRREFVRYGLSRYRALIGVLQILGALGIAVGYFMPYVAAFSSLGLSVLMLLGVITRLRIHDTMIQSFPAVSFFFLNLFIFVYEAKLV